MPALPTASERADIEARVEQLVGLGPDVPDRDFWGRQFDLGLAWVHFPVGFGGRGVDRELQEVVNAAVLETGRRLPAAINGIGIGMAGPTIMGHGSMSQKCRYLRRCFTCEDIWCQLFSEPGAGSDVASLATRAVPDGDQWIVNGQKVWTSLADRARWGLLLARTDPAQPKHRGLTYFVVDMRAPGVEVRPLRQLDGAADFNEVFFTDVAVSDRERLGDAGDGWRVAMTTLMNERAALGAPAGARPGSGAIAQAVALLGPGDGGPHRDRLMRLWIRAEVGRLTALRADQERRRGTPGPEGSVGKLAMAELTQDILAFCVELLGADGMLHPGYDAPGLGTLAGVDVRAAFLTSRHLSIGGGTSEIMRNILGERVLGLPPEPQPDRHQPWNQVRQPGAGP